MSARELLPLVKYDKTVWHLRTQLSKYVSDEGYLSKNKQKKNDLAFQMHNYFFGSGTYLRNSVLLYYEST